jgi:hypothetical protein
LNLFLGEFFKILLDILIFGFGKFLKFVENLVHKGTHRGDGGEDFEYVLFFNRLTIDIVVVEFDDLADLDL